MVEVLQQASSVPARLGPDNTVRNQLDWLSAKGSLTVSGSARRRRSHGIQEAKRATKNPKHPKIPKTPEGKPTLAREAKRGIEVRGNMRGDQDISKASEKARIETEGRSFTTWFRKSTRKGKDQKLQSEGAAVRRALAGPGRLRTKPRKVEEEKGPPGGNTVAKVDVRALTRKAKIRPPSRVIGSVRGRVKPKTQPDCRAKELDLP